MIKKALKKLILRERADSEAFVKYLKQKGVKVGEDVNFFEPKFNVVDTTCPWILSIGNHVNITHGVIILTHDYSWSVLKRIPKSCGAVLGAQSPVKIGNNVFIGMNAVITRGVTIGDNVVICAGSIVTKNCDSNSVYAGNPARRIMSVDEYCAKRMEAQFDEAKKMALIYKETFGKEPDCEVFREYFMLFCNYEQAKNIYKFDSQLHNCGNYNDSVAYMNDHKPMFDSYEQFLKAVYE